MNCDDCGHNVTSRDAFCRHCGNQVNPKPTQTSRGEAFDEDETNEALRRLYKRRFIVSCLLWCAVSAVGITIYVSTIANILPWWVVGVALVGGFIPALLSIRSPPSEKEYYSLPGARFVNGDHRCIHCGRRGRHGQGIYTHGAYGSDSTYHDCTGCRKTMFVE